ncbi:MAG: inositol monophosphatase [Proteobacteria bacterium]|nr:inositol monophosphatase [Pseudomonadota bacterium]
MRSAADKAAAHLMAGLSKPKNIEHKGPVDLVTEYDRQAEKIIKDHLQNLYPDIGMLAEESGLGSKKEGDQTTWIVDPLDGTTNFSHGHPVFAVSIGLEDNGRPVAGVIAIPMLRLTLWARIGGGAFCNGEPIRVTDTSRLGNSLVATGFPYDRRTSEDNNTRECTAFIKRCQGIRRCGAAAVDLAFVARGVYDGFFEPKLHAWDLAAGAVIVEEAGGRVTNYDGSPLDIYKGWIVASNGDIHQQMLDVLSDVRKKM